MDVSKELLSEVLRKVLEDSQNDVLELLLEQSEQLSYIQKKVDRIDENIEALMQTMTRLIADFSDLKSNSSDDESTLFMMKRKLNSIHSTFDSDDELEDYVAWSESEYVYWDKFDEMTRKFIPMSEFLFYKLQKCTEPDYSPMIVELCRAIENEFLKKVFSKYTLDLIKRHPNDLDTFLATDKASNFLKKKTGQFVKAITKTAQTNKPEYTLGTMNVIISMLNNSNIVTQSPLMTDFKNYLKNHADEAKLLSQAYVSDVDEIVTKFRNPSAHPGLMDIQVAKECKKCMPERLDYLLECIKS